MKTITEDKRPIMSIWLHDGSVFRAGSEEIDKIEPYQEPGQMNIVLWFAIIWYDKVKYRINGNFVETVEYRVP